MTNKNFMSVEDKSINEEQNNDSLPQNDSPSQEETETSRYLEQNISSDTEPELLNKGSTSIITKRYLLALTDENAPAFQEAFARGAIFTLTRPTQTHIDKLREVLSLEPEQVIPEDAQDPHVEIYAITSRNTNGGMLYTYIAESSANISVDVNSYDVTGEVEELGTISPDENGNAEVPASFFTTEAEDEITSDDIAKQRAERFLEWTRSIDSLDKESAESAKAIASEFRSAFSEKDIYGKLTQFDSDLGYVVMRPQFRVYSWHSFENDYEHSDFYAVKISGAFSPSEREKYQPGKISNIFLTKGYSSWYDINVWFDNGYDSNVILDQWDPENDNRETTYTSSRGINIGGNVGFTSNSNGDSQTIGGSGGVNFSSSKSWKGYDYDIEDHSMGEYNNNARWIFRFKQPDNTRSTPSTVSRGTLKPELEAVWRVKPDFWRTHSTYILRFRCQGALGQTSLGLFLRHLDYGKTTYRSILFMDPPPHIVTDTASIEMPSTSGNSYFTVQADENWSISTTASNWLGIMNVGSRNNASGTTRVILYRLRNTSSSPREGYITITGRDTDDKVRIYVRQDGR